LTLALKIDDEELKEVITSLYYPQSPYEFSVLPADILGQVYEQFLGKVIRLTAGHQARVEDKPEVKKAGGVYYTPTYIVEYIVKQTVGRLLEGKTPRQAAKLRVLDPACGSGSFLIGAYQRLLDWHRDWYIADGPAKHRKELYQAIGGWRLTTSERKRILLANIYGVDIDSQAVETTKLSLLLKVLEGESRESLELQRRAYHERALPDLANNIKCGNSLIGPDFYDGQPMNLLDEDERFRLNTFDWTAKRGFPTLMKEGGFHAVIGNPPWGAEFTEGEQEYLRRSFEAGRSSSVDSYALFLQRGLARLSPGGLLGFIVPDTFLRKDDRLPLRELLIQEHSVVELIETGPLFSQVRDTWCLVGIFKKTKPTQADKILHRKLSRFIVSTEERLGKFGRSEWDDESLVAQTVWADRPGLIVGYLTSERAQKLIRKVEKNLRLADLTHQFRISRGEEGSKFAIEEDRRGEYCMVMPKHVERFSVDKGVRVSRRTLTPSKIEGFYSRPKIWIIRIQKLRWRQRIVCAFDSRRDSAGMKTLQLIISPSDDEASLKSLSAILASRVINFWCINYLADDMNHSYLEKIPIPALSQAPNTNDRLIKATDQMFAIQRRLRAARTVHERTVLERQIEATDHQIDKLVYDLYGLTEKEIAIVEAATT
jgi:type I restriction-modification system DNA methylase subunit